MLGRESQQQRGQRPSQMLNAVNRMQASGHELFQLRNVELLYGKTLALQSIELSISKGEMLFITGPSGAGKTSLIKLLAQELLPTKGQIRMTNPKAFVNLIFQDLRLIPDWTVWQNVQVSYDPKIHGNKREFEHEVGEIAQYLGLQDKLGNKVCDISGGQRQKVAVMRSMAGRPDVVLADEPTSSLDTDNTYRLLELFSFYNLKMGTTIVWASHNREIVKKFTGRVLHLDGGRLIYSGSACFI